MANEIHARLIKSYGVWQPNVILGIATDRSQVPQSAIYIPDSAPISFPSALDFEPITFYPEQPIPTFIPDPDPLEIPRGLYFLRPTYISGLRDRASAW
jgi:hypothetical protein